MCRSKAVGGRRCAQSDRLEKLTSTQLAPGAHEGAPPVDWAGDDVGAIWASQDRAVACAAIEHIAEAARLDARTYPDMSAAAKAAGASLHGAAFRLKSPGSLARKIAVKMERARSRGVQVEPEEVAGTVTDVTRYTALAAEHDDIVPTARATLGELQVRGWRVIEAEQSYVSGNPYKGLHLLVQHEDGQAAELQIQSARSQQIKDRSHLLYEISRDTGRSREERLAADREGRQLYTELPAPAGLDRLAEIGGCPVSEKQYS